MSGMTDADYLDAIANGRYQVIESAAHHKERLRRIAARLRGDGEQGQAVAGGEVRQHCQMSWELKWPDRHWTCRQCGKVVVQNSSDGHPHRICSAAVAGDACPAGNPVIRTRIQAHSRLVPRHHPFNALLPAFPA